MRWFLFVCLVLYLAFVARLTLADPSAGQFAFSLADTWATRLSHGRLDWSETEVLANIALFIPVGFPLAALIRRPVLALALCFVGSAAIELSQREFLPTRVATIADVQHNVLGALLGVLITLPVIWLSRPSGPAVTVRGDPVPVATPDERTPCASSSGGKAMCS